MNNMRSIPGWPEYGITTDGRVWRGSAYRAGGHWMPMWKDSAGYLYVTLYTRKIKSRARVHRLVLLTFAGPCPIGKEGCHNNGNKSDNSVDNLRWDMRRENNLDAVRRGYTRNAKVTKEQVQEIRREYHRGMREVIARKYGLHVKSVSRILCGRTWSHVE
jgi:hypothetical protein